MSHEGRTPQGVRELKLEKYVAIMNAPSYPSQPNYPTTVPGNPQILWCSTTGEKTVYDGSDEKSEKKADGKTEA